MRKRTPPPGTVRLLNQPSKERVIAAIEWLLITRPAEKAAQQAAAQTSVTAERKEESA